MTIIKHDPIGWWYINMNLMIKLGPFIHLLHKTFWEVERESRSQEERREE